MGEHLEYCSAFSIAYTIPANSWYRHVRIFGTKLKEKFRLLVQVISHVQPVLV